MWPANLIPSIPSHRGRMEEKVKASEEQLKQAKEEAAEVYAVKDKLREANVARQALERKVIVLWGGE